MYGEPETRRRILQAAWDLLEKRGPMIRISDVAQAARVSRQAVYLHFGDRAGLFVALVDHIDLSLGSAQMRAHVYGAPTGVESLRRWIETMSWYTERIDVITYVLESAQYRDAGLGAAWRNRMDRRHDIIRTIVERVAAEGHLAEGWEIDTVVDLVYVVTMPGAWRELTRELGWTHEQYAKHLTGMVERSLLTGPAGLPA
jgi:AcrR family transcriptional regulator